MFGDTLTLDDLSTGQRDVLTTIVGGRLAWTLMTDVDPVFTTSLVALGLVERWSARSIDAVTLTPFGSWLMEVEIVERVRIVGDELEEDPVWAKRPANPPRLRLPRRAHEVRFPWMETFPDPLPGPEFLIDDESGKPVEMFAKLFDGEWVGGIKVVIDKRMKRARKAKTKRRKAG